MNSANAPLNVLLIEDSSEYASLILQWVSAGGRKAEMNLIWTDSLAAGLARLEQGGIDLVLMDLGLPDSDGLNTFTTLHARAPDRPIIVLSGADSEALALQTIQLGAQDYLVKSTCTPQLLTRTVRHALVRHRAIGSRTRPDDSWAKAKILAVLGSVGGAGATAVACVLADELRMLTDEPTLLMDLVTTPGLVAFTMGVDPQFSIREALGKAGQLDRSLWEELTSRRPNGLEILSAAETIDAADWDVDGVRQVIDYAAGHYRWIVMDLGRLTSVSARILKSSSEVMLVSTGRIPALHRCKHAIAELHGLGIDNEHIRLILNQRHARNQLSRRDIEHLFGARVEAFLPPAHEELHDAQLQGRLPGAGGQFRQIISGVARRLAGLPEEAPKRPPLLSLASLLDRFQGKAKAGEEEAVASSGRRRKAIENDA